jgi:hypothetical protein
VTARKADRPLSRRLEALGEAVPAAKRRERECEIAHRSVVAEIAQLTDAVAESYADGDEGRAAKASKQRAALESGSLREAEERLEGARRTVSRAEAERGVFAAENIDGLLRERNGDAAAVARAAEQAIVQLSDAHAAWNAVEAEIAGLLRLAGRDTRDLPKFPVQLATLVSDARRADGVQVPPPVPGGHAIVPAPKVRSEAP